MYFNFAIIAFFLICEKSIIKCSFEVLRNVEFLLTAIKVKEVTAKKTEFLALHDDFVRNLASRHNRTASKMVWHFLSGAAVYIPKFDINFLFERVFYSFDNGKGHHTSVEKSFLIYTPWNSNWSSPISASRLLEVNDTSGSIYLDNFNKNERRFEGPEDARVIFLKEKNEIYFNFNVLTPSIGRQMCGLRAHVDIVKSKILISKTEYLARFEHEKSLQLKVEKNWTPIFINGELHFFYSFYPLRILKCEKEPKNLVSKKSTSNNDVSTIKKICRVQFNGEIVGHGPQNGYLRGGTNWVEYSKGIFFSLARTKKKNPKIRGAFYRPHLVVLKFDIDSKLARYTNPQIIFVSDPIKKFDSVLFGIYAKKYSNNKNCKLDKSVLTPGSITNWTGMDQNENSDIADVIISVNDDVNVMIQIKGLGYITKLAVDHFSKSVNKRSGKSLVEMAENQMQILVDSFDKI